MITKKVDGFLENEKVKIEANNLREASFLLGKAMKEKTKDVLNKSLEELSEDGKNDVLNKAKLSLDKLREWSEREMFVFEGENLMKRFLETFEGYCEGSGLSEVEGAYLQIDIEAGCQTLIAQNKETGVISMIHSEEDAGPAFDLNSYNYKWIEMVLPEKTVSFLAYPGLCTWGPAFGVNEKTLAVQAVDDLYIRSEFDNGVIWPIAMVFMSLDLGDIMLIKELVERVATIDGPKFVGGYGVHLAQGKQRPEMLSFEFANDKIKVLEPVIGKNNFLVAQVNCPVDKKIAIYSESGYPSGKTEWSRNDAELYVEMKNRRERLLGFGEETKNWPDQDLHESVNLGLKILANPWGDIDRRIIKETGGFRYVTTGLPSRVMNSHLSVSIGSNSLEYYAGKLKPEPIVGEEYEKEVSIDYKYGLKKIWEEGAKELEAYNKNVQIEA